MDPLSFFFIFFAFFVFFIIIGIARRRAIRRQIMAQNAAYVAANAGNYQVQQAVQAQQAQAAYYNQHVGQVGVNPNGQQPAYLAAVRPGQAGPYPYPAQQYASQPQYPQNQYAPPQYSQTPYSQPQPIVPAEGQPNPTIVPPQIYQGNSPPPGYTQ